MQAAIKHIQALLQLPEIPQHLPYHERLQEAVRQEEREPSRDQVGVCSSTCQLWSFRALVSEGSLLKDACQVQYCCRTAIQEKAASAASNMHSAGLVSAISLVWTLL